MSRLSVVGPQRRDAQDDSLQTSLPSSNGFRSDGDSSPSRHHATSFDLDDSLCVPSGAAYAENPVVVEVCQQLAEGGLPSKGEEMRQFVHQAVSKDADGMQRQLAHEAKLKQQAEANAASLEAERNSLWERLVTEESKRLKAEAQAAAMEREWDAIRERLAVERVRRERAEEWRSSVLRRINASDNDAVSPSVDDVIAALEGQLHAAKEALDAREEELRNALSEVASYRRAAADERREREGLDARVATLEVGITSESAAIRTADVERRRREAAEARVASLEEELNALRGQLGTLDAAEVVARVYNQVQKQDGVRNRERMLADQVSRHRAKAEEEQAACADLARRLAAAEMAAARELESSRNDCSVLRRKLDAEQLARESHASQSQLLQSQLASSEQVITKLTRRAEQEVADMQGQKAQLREEMQQEVAALQHSHSSQQAQLESQERRLIEEATEVARARVVLEAAEKHVQRLSGLEDELCEEHLHLSRKAEAAEDDAAKHRDTCAAVTLEFRNELATAQERIRLQDAHATERERHFNTLESQLRHATEQRAEHQQRHVAEQLEALEVRLLREFADREGEQLRILRRQLDEARLDASARSDQVNLLQKELQNVMRERSLHHEGLRELRREQEENSVQLQAAVKTHEQKTEELHAVRKVHDQKVEELHALHQEHAEKTRELHAVRREHEDRTEQFHVFRKELDTHRSDNVQLLQHLQSLQREFDEAQRSWQEELDEIQRDRWQKSEQMHFLRLDVERCRHQEECEIEQVEELRSNLKEAQLGGEQTSRVMRQEVDEMLRSSQKATLVFNEATEAMQQELEEAHRTHEASTEGLQKQLQDARRQKETQQNVLQAELQEALKDREGLRHLLAQEAAEMQRRIQDGCHAAENLRHELLEALRSGQETSQLLRDELDDAVRRGEEKVYEAVRVGQEELKDALRRGQETNKLLREELDEALYISAHVQSPDVSQSLGLDWDVASKPADDEQKIAFVQWAAEQILEARNIAVEESAAADEARRTARLAEDSMTSLEKCMAAFEERQKQTERAHEQVAEHRSQALKHEFQAQQARLRAELVAEQGKCERFAALAEDNTLGSPISSSVAFTSPGSGKRSPFAVDTTDAATFRQRLAAADEGSTREMSKFVEEQRKLIMQAMSARGRSRDGQNSPSVASALSSPGRRGIQ